jgi:dienelactone hydrolase
MREIETSKSPVESQENVHPSAIGDYEKSVFTASLRNGQVVAHDVYARGQGPVVVVIQELPGIGTATLRLVDSIVASGFRVLLPHLFGPLGRTDTVGNLARIFCMRREFHLFQKNRSSPIVDWLKALCVDTKITSAGEGVGVIGMCLTGNFAMSLMADDSVLAAVASQPSMPFGKAEALHMSEDEIHALKARIDATAPMKAYRFEGDWMCSAEKFEAIEQTLNDGAQRVELKTLPGKGHAVLTEDFVNEAGHPTKEALEEILSYFHQQLNIPA